MSGEKRVDLSKIKTNMVLSRNVVSDTGIILMTENTMLNDRNIMKLRVYDIDSVYVKVTSEGDVMDFKEPIQVNESEVRIPVVETKQFIEFENSYERKEDEAKDSLLSIGNGNNINLPQLYSITNDLMGSLRSKSDLFIYLGHLKQKDDHTYSHCINVSLLCNLFGLWLGFKSDEIINITTSGLLHDIGKTIISTEILSKPGKLTKAEFEEIKKHTVYGYRMVENQNISDNIKKAVLMHHERINGTGYPTGAKGNQINSYAKIVAIADIYDAMTADRSYRNKICPFDVIKTFEQECYGELDTEYLLVFLKNIAYTYIGSWVVLSNGQVGEVIFINSKNLSMPIVRVDKDFIDLSLRRDITIESME